MKKLAPLFFLLLLATVAHGQVVEPKVPPKPIAPLVPAKIVGKPGKLVVIDAKAAKGKVSFKYDRKIFDKESAEEVDKRLLLVMPAAMKEAQTFVVVVTSWADELQEDCVITVAGTDSPVIDPSLAPIDKLAAKFDAFAKAQATTNAAIISSLNSAMARLDALEKNPPKPDPPKPDPVIPAPIPEIGFRVLMIYETAEAIKLTKGQQLAMFGKSTRDWLDANCVKVGGEPERRIFDKDIKLDGESALWKKAMARTRTGVPWLIVSNGITGYDGPMPETLDAIMAILKKHAPQ